MGIIFSSSTVLFQCEITFKFMAQLSWTILKTHINSEGTMILNCLE
jgi:hypothetical protein